jgi:K+ transporter
LFNGVHIPPKNERKMPTLTSLKSGKMGKAAEAIFAYLQRNAVDVESTFCLPPDRVVEIGTQIDV